jgi:PLP dependent protein
VLWHDHGVTWALLVRSDHEPIDCRQHRPCSGTDSGRLPGRRARAEQRAIVGRLHAAGQTAFGENYIQEAVDKITALRDLPLQWHCIGPIQSNKTRLVAEHFDWVHSVDRLKIAQRLSDQRPAELPPLQVCIQVNVDGGDNKSGVSPQDLPALAQAVAALPRLQLRGLMTIPEPAETDAQMRAVHRQAKDLFEQLRTQGLPLDTLSMGMSADMDAAIAEGSTIVRVGTAIFGQR